MTTATRALEKLAMPGFEGATRARIHYLDWLRAIAVLVIVAFHAVLPFEKGLAPWYVQNAEASEALGRVDAVLMFLFPIFFVFAGASARLALQRRSIGAFLRERTIRLGVPYVVGTAVLVVPTMYYLATYSGKTEASYFGFVPSWATTTWAAVTSAGFSPQVLGVGDWLWFLAWLLMFAVLASPIFAALGTAPGRRLVEMLSRFARWPGATLLFVVPITIFALPFFRITPTEQWIGWWAFGIYFPMFVGGYLIFCDERLVAAVRRDLLLAVVASALALYGIAATGFTASIFAGGAHTSDLYYVFIVFLHALIAWAPAVAVLSAGMWVPAFRRPLPRILAETSLPTYVLHQPIVLVLSSVVVSWSLGLWPKAVINIGLGVALSFAAAAVAVRIPGVRTLLGVRVQRPMGPSVSTSMTRGRIGPRPTPG